MLEGKKMSALIWEKVGDLCHPENQTPRQNIPGMILHTPSIFALILTENGSDNVEC